MSTSINVNKQTVLEFLSTGKTKPFVIPEYQRPYMWGEDQVTTLFNDIWDFALNTGGTERTGYYFLGTVVSYENERGEQEIIDGQQRATSLFLLLRATYTKLIGGDNGNSKATQNFLRKIEPAIWRTNNLTGEVDYSDILLTSRVIDNDGNEILRKILEKGVADPDATDNYSRNYLIFQRLYDEHCKDSAMQIYEFVYALLNQAILLPIGADSQDTALTIFSTLNNRGLQLSDADIFKAKIYNHLPADKKEAFINKWKKLDKEAADTNESIQQLFYYYMFYIRAKEGDVSSTTPGIRKYYSQDNFTRLYDPKVMDDLNTILNLWKVINTRQDVPGETWDNDLNITKALDTLTSYPNEFWKYPVIIFYLAHRQEADFNQKFRLFLNKLVEELMVLYIFIPTINAVKSDIMKLNANIIKSSHPEMSFKPIDKARVKENIKTPHRNIVRMLLKSYAYDNLNQDHLLPATWQIEHILPQHWQKTFFPETPDEVVNEMIEHIGNKTPFERKLNIVASDGYFSKKQEQYKKSEIAVTKMLADDINYDWKLANITHRDEVVSSKIMELIELWDKEYREFQEHPTTGNAIPEDVQKQLEEYRKRGWIK